MKNLKQIRTASIAAVAALTVALGSASAVAEPGAAPAPFPALPFFNPAPAPAPAPAPEGAPAPEAAPAPAPAPGPALPELPALPAIAPAPAPAPEAAPMATPRGGKEMVVFGDSFSANAGKNGARPLEPGQTPDVANCATDMENWPKIAAKELGKSLGDWSCNSTGTIPRVQLLNYIQRAIDFGDVGPDTNEAVIMYGGGDALMWVNVGDRLIPSLNLNIPEFNETMRLAGEMIKKAAPNARITMTSYQTISDNDQLCLVNTPGQTHPIPVPGAAALEGAFRDTLAEAAHVNNYNFIDVYAESHGHGTCAPDDERWMAGFVDPKLGPMVNHPTVQGEIAMGHIIAKHLR